VTCKRPPTGWKCTRDSGHSGPCAAIRETYKSQDVDALSRAIHRAAMLRTEQVTLTAPEARALLAYVVELEKFSEPPVAGFPISTPLDWHMSTEMTGWWTEDHKQGKHTYSAFCILCTAG
jgi:hypothetical protein